jgi:hypothetical protein
MSEEKTVELTQDALMNRLFCSFVVKDDLDQKIRDINREYRIMYKKIFVLESPESKEFMCTYNIEVDGNRTKILDNTILLHRKKESNTLYTINALNTLIKSLNGGRLDSKFPIQWTDYKNSILLTQGDELRKLNTKIYKIITV